MSSRLTFRPRPLDIHKKLPIVKSVKDLDSDEGVSRSVQHNHIALDAENELVLSATPTRRGGGAEIPTPNFEVVESYEKDYTRSFNQPPSYLRGRGARSEATEYVEYDLDDEDEDWLHQLNAERRILAPERFEWMLYKMELLDHKSRERAGGMPISQGVRMPVLLQHDDALEALRVHTSRFAVLDAVYEYWKSKRDRWQKPILRRLQKVQYTRLVRGLTIAGEKPESSDIADGYYSLLEEDQRKFYYPPPPVNDTNPFNVFRPREKVHRPHTRRMQRRENDISSFEKLRQVIAFFHVMPSPYIARALQDKDKTVLNSLKNFSLALPKVRRNLEQSRNLMLALQKREEKKRELVECEATLQRVQIKLRHDSRVDDDALMATNSSLFTPRKFPPSKRGEDGQSTGVQGANIGAPDQINGHVGSVRHPSELSTPAADGAVGDQMDRMRHKRKRRRLPPPRGRPIRRMKVMDSLEPVLLFTKPLDAEKLAAVGILPPIEPPLENGLSAAPCRFHGRIGRGGRIIFDRWNPLTRTPIVSSSFPFTSPPSMSPPGPRFHAPPPPRLDIDATTHPNLNSATAAAVEHTSSTNAPLP